MLNIKTEDFADSKIMRFEVGTGIDIIGDIHACYDEFIELLNKLGYKENSKGLYLHPVGRKIVSLGDIMSRGPKSITTMLFFLKHIQAGLAYMVDSNHGWKIARWLQGKNVKMGHGDEKFAKEFQDYEKEHGEAATNKIKEQFIEMLLNCPPNIVFAQNGNNVVIAVHAGIRDKDIGRDSKSIRSFIRYGDTDGLDEKGKPIRKDWFKGHQTDELIVWGHDPRLEPMVINNTINIDQGVVFGGKLTAFRYPEKELVSVSAKKDYAGDPDSHITKQIMLTH